MNSDILSDVVNLTKYGIKVLAFYQVYLQIDGPLRIVLEGKKYQNIKSLKDKEKKNLYLNKYSNDNATPVNRIDGNQKLAI